MGHLHELFTGKTPILPTLRALGVEPDQKFLQALQMAMGLSIPFDSNVFHALIKLNTHLARLIDIDKYRERILKARAGHQYFAQENSAEVDLFTPAGLHFDRLMNRAFRNRRRQRHLTTGDFLEAVIDDSIEYGDNHGARCRTADFLAALYSGDVTTPFSQIPEIRDILARIKGMLDWEREEDFQYALTLTEDRIAFRVISVLDDYVQASDSSVLVPQRALLTHLGRIGVFTNDEVEELEALVNAPSAAERDFQSFFEEHPHFFRRWDYRDVHPQVFLTRVEAGPLIPDFILCNNETQDAAILDIKTTLTVPRRTMVRRQRNRERFSDVVQEACAQLRTYRRWFEVPDNRRLLTSKLGMEIYNPRLMVIIGRAAQFRDQIERGTLRADNPDVEIATYDDIISYARARMVIIQGDA